MAKILVIEDDSLVAETLGAVLTRAGHAVAIAPEGNAALAAFNARTAGAAPFDLVITDIIMPGMEGIETIRRLRAEAPALPIIAISGGGRTNNYDFLEFARYLGASAVLAKPFAHSDLLAMVNHCLSLEPH